MRPRKRELNGVQLRPYRVSDHRRWRDGYLASTEPLPGPQLRRAAFERKLAQHRRGMAQDLYYALGIFELDSKQHLGGIDVYVLARLDLQVGGIGWWLHSQHRGRGYASEAVRLAIDVAREDLRLHRLEASIQPNNKRSIRLAKRVGMARDGIRKSWCWEGADWADHVIYSVVLSDEAPRVKPTLRSAL